MRKTERVLIIGSWLFLLLLSLSFAPMFQHRMDAGRAENGLSEDYREFSIGRSRDIIDSRGIVFLDFVQLLQSKEKPYILLRKKASNLYSCVQNDMQLSLPLVRGRTFSEQDMDIGANVALICERSKKNIYYQNSIPMIEIEGCEYEVIGIFKEVSNAVNPQPDFVVNGLSENEMTKSSYIDGTYLLQTENVDMMTEEVIAWCGAVLRKTPYQKTNGEKWDEALSVTLFSAKFLVIIGLFCIIAFAIIVRLWLRHLRKEIFVRRLCGCSRVRAWRWSSGKYVLSATIGTMTAVPFALVFGIQWRAECAVLACAAGAFALVWLMSSVTFRIVRNGGV